MTVRNLDALFQPRSVAVIGASTRAHSVGAQVMRNVIDGGFSGPIYPVNPKYDRILGIKTYTGAGKLPDPPELAVICTPPATVPELVEQLGRRGTRAVVVLSAGLGTLLDKTGRSLTQAMLDAARPHLMRVLGPNCVGLLVPGIGLNASFAHTNALPGEIAFISQSGALVTAVLDWANARRIGFSHFVSLGESADVDFADLIDYLGSDANTRAILLYAESIKRARKFMTAARAAARNKPLIVVKAGRAPEGAKAAASHTGALAGADDVFDAAIRRAGMLRVDSMLDLFSAVETLSHISRFNGERIAIMTNGGGAGVMAADAVALAGAKLAPLSAPTLARLDAILPATWSRGNPIDIIGDAPVERYVKTLRILGDEPQADAILFIHAPTAIVSSSEIAAACAPIVRALDKCVLSCWLGEKAVARAREIFHDAGIADYATPEEAVRAVQQLVTYRRNQELLLQTPPASNAGPPPDKTTAIEIVRRVLQSQRRMLTEPEAKDVLRAYAIPVVETRIAASPELAATMAEELGFPVALKILSPDITHKSDVGGVALNLGSAADVGAAARAMLVRVDERRPGARVGGFTVQRMLRRPGAHELIAGIAVDPMFGPVILFGQGGTAVEVVADRAVALPPLNVALARELVARTRVAKLLAGYRDRPAADLDAIYAALGRLSQMLIDIPELVELDINPLLADHRGVVALDARIRVAPSSEAGYERLAIRPYPQELEERLVWEGRELLIRPIRAEDTEQHLRFLQQLSPHDIRMRVFHTRRYIAPSELARLTQIDYEREMAFIATLPDAAGKSETIGVVRAVTDPENAVAEFGIIVRSDMKGKGLGRMLFEKIIRYCRGRGTAILAGDVLRENTPMLDLARRFGFAITRAIDADTVQVKLDLRRVQD
ncbi:MAG: bifunctional acetate--CoA ligase family protein/GNAT family N-acetyltransferase [Burkholderiales bacterium]|nr:bifunctional acetate--CoA ligase family protein/GNAT family N-acetyltransferase [Burkholderiales bacterium]